MSMPRFVCEVPGCKFRTDDYYAFEAHDCEKDDTDEAGRKARQQ